MIGPSPLAREQERINSSTPTASVDSRLNPSDKTAGSSKLLQAVNFRYHFITPRAVLPCVNAAGAAKRYQKHTNTHRAFAGYADKGSRVLLFTLFRKLTRKT